MRERKGEGGRGITFLHVENDAPCLVESPGWQGVAPPERRLDLNEMPMHEAMVTAKVAGAKKQESKLEWGKRAVNTIQIPES